MDSLVKLILAIFGAIAAWFVADQVSVATTGKHLSDHLGALWGQMMSTVVQWQRAHPNQQLVKLVGVLASAADQAVGRLLMALRGTTDRGELIDITTQVLTVEQYQALLQQADSSRTVELTELLTNAA